MSRPSNTLKQWYWKGRDKALSTSRSLSFRFNLIKTGILPNSAAEKCIRIWEQHFQWFRHRAGLAGFSIANRDNLIEYKTSDTLFVLGSGPSINAISEEEWDTISQHDSIGFNYFIAHPFVPTFYHMELLPKDIAMFTGCYSQRRSAYKNTPFMINYNYISDDYNSLDLSFIDNKLITIPREYYDAKPDDLAKIFSFTHDHIGTPENTFLLHYRGSLCLMISLAVLLGYRKVVLAGIDLNNSSYFFCDSRYNCEATQALVQRRCQESPESVNAPHATADPRFIPITITIDRVLHILDQAVLKKRGIELYVYNKQSLLYPSLPSWQDH